MQKTTKNASILIWAIFLSIIISLWFISISTQINKTLRNNQDIQHEILNKNELKNILNWNNIISQELSDGSYLSISDTKSYFWSLKNNESKIFTFSWTTLDFIKINIKNGSPIRYTYNIWSNNQEYDILRSGSKSFSWNLNNFTNNSTLIIENLGWYSLFEIISDLNFTAPERYYEVWKKIWNKNVLLETGQIK